MKKYKAKVLYVCVCVYIVFSQFLIQVQAEPKPNEAAAKDLVTTWVKPFTSIALWAIPSVMAAVILISGIAWMTKDEESREQKPFKKTAIGLFKLGVILELVPTIMKILGL